MLNYMLLIATIAKKLVEMFPEYFQIPIKHTSRAPRQGEENGKHFHFVQKSDIEGGIARGEYVEHTTVSNSMYGIHISSINNIRKQNKICILDLELKDIQLVKNSPLVVKYIFLCPPSIEEFDTRLKTMNVEPLSKISLRVSQARNEIELGKNDEHIDKFVVNDNIPQCINRLIYQLDGFYPEFDFHKDDEIET